MLWTRAGIQRMERSFDQFLVSLGHERIRSNPTLYVFKEKVTFIFFLIYVDDVLIFSNVQKKTRKSRDLLMYFKSGDARK